MAHPSPGPDPDTAPYWQALTEGKLCLCRCDDTGTWIHPPLERSRITGGPVHFEEVSGRGSVFSYIVIRQALVPGRTPPYVVALVELDEQPGLRISAVVNAPPDEVHIGLRLRLQVAAVGQTGYSAAEFVIETDSSPRAD